MSDTINILELSDAELDAMTPEQTAAYASEMWASSSDPRGRFLLESVSAAQPIVAVGDSWFDYQPAGLDILDFLQKMPDYEILDHGVAGDTVENMAYGTTFNRRRYRPKRPRLDDALEDLRDSGAKVFLVSGGGNDVAGVELENLLNHAETGLPAMRHLHVDYLVDTVFRSAFEHIFERVWAVDPDVQIIGHGYGNAVPDGRGVIRVLGFQWIGPWLRPAMTKKRILDPQQQQHIVDTLITRLNDLLQSLAETHANYHAIDARPVINSADWENELHLKNSAFRRVAMLFHDKIQALNGGGGAGA